MLQRAAQLEFAFKEAAFEPVRVARTLHHGATGHRLTTHEQGDADHALIAYDCDLRRSPVLHDVEQGDDAAGGEIDISRLAAGFGKSPAESQRNEFQVG